MRYNETMILETPLSDEEVQILKDMRVGLWHSYTGQTYINKNYWFGSLQGKRDAIAFVLETLREEEGQGNG